MKLEVMILGDYLSVQGLRMAQSLVKKIKAVFGPDWRRIMLSMGCGPEGTEAFKTVRGRLGKAPTVVYRKTGILMQSDSFGLVVKVDGVETMVNLIDRGVGSFDPAMLMQDFTAQDLLGVFGMRGGGYLKCEWDELSGFSQEKLAIAYDDIRGLLNRKESMELVHTFTYDGLECDRQSCCSCGQLDHAGQAFHVKKG